MVNDDIHEVVVTDVKVHFWSMVLLMVEWAIASIPAVIILYLVAIAMSVVFDTLSGTWWHWWNSRPT